MDSYLVTDRNQICCHNFRRSWFCIFALVRKLMENGMDHYPLCLFDEIIVWYPG